MPGFLPIENHAAGSPIVVTILPYCCHYIALLLAPCCLDRLIKCMLFSDRYTVETTEHFEKEFKRLDRYTQRTMALSDGELSFDLPDPRQ